MHPGSRSGGAGLSTAVADARSATALVWAPDGRLFFAERAGSIKIASPAGVSVLTTVNTVTSERGGGYSERGVLGLALSPTFGADHFVYRFVSHPDYATQAVMRFTECAGVVTASTTLLTVPSGPDCCHKGGRLAFGPDGKLYVTLGDAHAGYDLAFRVVAGGRYQWPACYGYGHLVPGATSIDRLAA